MIISDSFNGDTNKTLKYIQHELYGELLYRLFSYAKDRYLRASRFLGVKTLLGKLIEPKESFDHRVLQNAHDKIAAYYRFAHDNRGQMSLPFDGKSYEDSLREEWQRFFIKTAQELADDDAAATAILTAIAYQNTSQGYAAEEHLATLLDDIYSVLDDPLEVVVIAKPIKISSSSVDAGKVAGQLMPLDPDWGNVMGEFVYIPAGKFLMGSEDNRYNEPIHGVVISQSFEMIKYQVTQGQWEAVMGNNPSYFKGVDLPVECVSWEDVQGFIECLNRQSTKYTYRLPTEAEWEYAGRAGSKEISVENLDAMGWYWNNSGEQTHPVGQKQPNVWGLYDMQGNVWEWCSDWHGNYPRKIVTNPTGAISGLNRVFRGGSWGNADVHCQLTNRRGGRPDLGSRNVGFRLVRTLR